ncbi:hypothetical protein TI39_contig352g00002 [Zymoseptoria brevis]|uniref:Peptidase A1 domain-containing protein n=1 Tax=Zymoseptoria brevis TaxID=1047168 RepID=A0A0F4GR81_9PEZI|nr:hypothetical protein TI39_contig352g00002 [Zymoseptoria brevis]
MHILFSYSSLSVLTLLTTLVSASSSLEDVSQPERARRSLLGVEVDIDLNTQLIAELGIAITGNVLPLTSSGITLDVGFGRGAYGPVESVFAGNAYAITINIDGSDYPVILDTGSSDLWLPKHDFVCEDVNGTVIEQKKCYIGPGPPAFSEGSIDDQIFNIYYADGEFASGGYGFGTVSFGGVTVPKQQYALVDRLHWDGDGFTSGLIGFGFPSITAAAYKDPKSHNQTYPMYNPWIFSAIENGDVVPGQFTIGLYRRGRNDTNGSPRGFLSLGGTPPPADLPYTGVWASTPIIQSQSPHYNFTPSYTTYSIQVDGITVNGEFMQWIAPIQNDTGLTTPTSVDFGYSLSYLHSKVVDAIARAFDPVPARIPQRDDQYFPLCNSTVPEVSFRIGGQDFAVNPRDVLIGDAAGEQDGGICTLGFFNWPADQEADGYSPAAPVFGDNFLRNAVVVHDVERYQLAFGGVHWD